jgi:hypothetical protein
MKREPSARGFNWATLFLGDINMGTWHLQVGGVSNETVKYGLSSAGLGPQSDCSGKVQKQLYERGHPTARNPQLSNRKQKSGHGLQMGA